MSKLNTRICPRCDQLLDDAANAMRHHSADMALAINLAQSGNPTDQQRQEFTTRLVESFNDAQSAWDAYREHLVEHGLLSAK